jgi:hypothetical protein
MERIDELDHRLRIIEDALRHAHLLPEPAPTIVPRPNTAPAPAQPAPPSGVPGTLSLAEH